MGKLIEAIKEHSDLLIASVVLDILLVGYWDMANRIGGGWSTIIGSNTPRGSAGIYFALLVLCVLVVNTMLIYGVVKSLRESHIASGPRH